MVAGTLEDGEEGGPTSEVVEDSEAREATEVAKTTREATEASPTKLKNLLFRPCTSS